MLLLAHFALALLLAGVVLAGLTAGELTTGRTTLAVFGVTVASTAVGGGLYFCAVLLAALTFVALFDAARRSGG